MPQIHDNDTYSDGNWYQKDDSFSSAFYASNKVRATLYHLPDLMMFNIPSDLIYPGRPALGVYREFLGERDQVSHPSRWKHRPFDVFVVAA